MSLSNPQHHLSDRFRLGFLGIVGPGPVHRQVAAAMVGQRKGQTLGRSSRLLVDEPDRRLDAVGLFHLEARHYRRSRPGDRLVDLRKEFVADIQPEEERALTLNFDSENWKFGAIQRCGRVER